MPKYQAVWSDATTSPNYPRRDGDGLHQTLDEAVDFVEKRWIKNNPGPDPIFTAIAIARLRANPLGEKIEWRDNQSNHWFFWIEEVPDA